MKTSKREPRKAIRDAGFPPEREPRSKGGLPGRGLYPRGIGSATRGHFLGPSHLRRLFVTLRSRHRRRVGGRDPELIAYLRAALEDCMARQLQDAFRL